MDPSTSENGPHSTNNTAKVCYFSMMEVALKVHGLMDMLMDVVVIYTTQENITKGTGKTICYMATGLFSMRTDPAIQECLSLINSMDTVLKYGLMALFIPVSL